MMGWISIPDWLTESRAAIIISLASAAVAAFSLRYTRMTALSRLNELKRKVPVLELEILADADTPPGWHKFQATLRNLAPVSVTIIGLKAKKRAALLQFAPDFEPYTTDEYGGQIPSSTPPQIEGTRTITLCEKMGPAGTKSTHRLSPVIPDTKRFAFFAKGIGSATDVALQWQWADGQKP